MYAVVLRCVVASAVGSKPLSHAVQDPSVGDCAQSDEDKAAAEVRMVTRRYTSAG